MIIMALLTHLFIAVLYIHLPLMLEHCGSMNQKDMISSFMTHAVLKMTFVDAIFSMYAELLTTVNNTLHYPVVVRLHLLTTYQMDVFAMTNTAYIFSSAMAWGGGHYIDVTGKRFDYRDQGEFLLLEMGPEHSQLQAVLNYLYSWNSRWFSVSVHRSFAFGEPGSFSYQVSVVFVFSVVNTVLN